MSVATEARRRSRTASRLGVPVLRGHGLFITGNLIDSVGNGMLLPLGLLYFTDVQGLPLGQVGVAMSAGQAIALPVTFLAGRLMDRVGPKRVVVWANILSAAGFALFLLAGELWHVVGVYLLVQAGINMYFTAQRTLIIHVTEPEERRSWFAFTGSLRNIGLAAGSAAAAGALTVFGKGSLWWMIAVDAATYLLAAACFAALTTTPPEPKDASPSALVTRADNSRRYLLLVAVNIPYVLAQAILAVLIALYTTRALGLPASAASVLFVINTVIISGCSTVVTAHVAPKVPRRAVVAGYLIMTMAMGAFALPALPRLAFTAWAALVVAIALFSVAEILLGPALSELSVSLTPEAAGGFTQGLYQFSWAIGMVAAPALFALLLEAGPLLPWGVEAAACLIAVFAAPALKAPNRHRRRKPR
ncbi:MFS transporter [Streptomyces candidus]|uniref:MFS family permease n=1 Tax=Streptomyces candidus TaxID=67283 RepID=A0A7X0HEF9_9ACTN|nr:MFS transporter [Streptomyces candidus]MBB6436127.1 MFS family permease [Streptomyces candidus]GHH43722.1 MFS transporter [Streptomyces candidus]